MLIFLMFKSFKNWKIRKENLGEKEMGSGMLLGECEKVERGFFGDFSEEKNKGNDYEFKPLAEQLFDFVFERYDDKLTKTLNLHKNFQDVFSLKNHKYFEKLEYFI